MGTKDIKNKQKIIGKLYELQMLENLINSSGKTKILPNKYLKNCMQSDTSNGCKLHLNRKLCTRKPTK